MAKKRKQPDATKHLQLSLIKSGFRIFAGLLLASVFLFPLLPIEIVPLAFYVVPLSGIALVIAEIIGIFEELV